MKTVLKIFANLLWIVLLLTIVFPIGWFVWRSNQPMDLPQFNGLSYRQYMAWQKISYHDTAVKYHETYPNKKMGGGLDMCYNVEFSGDLLARLPLSGLETLAGIFPSLKKVIEPAEWVYIPQNVTLQTFLPNWWAIFEHYLWNGAEYQPNTSVVYCRLQPDIPTPDELELLQNQSRQAVTP